MNNKFIECNKYIRFIELLLLLLCSIIIYQILFYNKASAKTLEKNHILILQSYDSEHEWERNILSGINSTFQSKLKNYSIDLEYMHMKKYSGKEYFEKLSNFYEYKYGNINYDVIITCDNFAFNFMNTYHDKIFKDTPIVFCGVNNFNYDILKSKDYIAGVTEEPNIKETIDIAINQNIGIKELNVLLSHSATGNTYKKLIEDISYLYKEKLKINIVQLNEILEAEKALNSFNKNSAVILADNFKDSYGDYIPYSQVADVLTSKSNIPIYGFWDFLLNHGIVGGVVINSKQHGELVAEIALKIINGEKPSNIKIIRDGFLYYMFDYKAMTKFGISKECIPINSTIINEANKFYYMKEEQIQYIIIFIITILSMVVIAMAININKRKKVESELKENEQQLKTLIDALPNIICFKDDSGRWLQANKAAIKTFRIGDMNYKGKTSRDIANEVKEFVIELCNCEKSDREAWDSGEMHKSREVLKSGEINEEIYEFVKIPMFNNDGTRKGMVIIGKDVTEENQSAELRKKVEKNQKLLDEALAYDKIRTEFFANISHELKTPLNVIFSTVQLLDLYLRNEKLIDNGSNMNRNLYVLKQNCFRLLRLVNNLIDITKLDAGYFQLHLKNTNIVSVVEEITLSVAEFIENKEIELIFDTDYEEKFIACDEDKIERIMLNLLSNAIKFTPEGGQIKVDIYEKNDKIGIHVKDNGIGIPKDNHKMIFERFRQVDKSLTRNREGSGIGLSLVKSLVELHNGSINVRSECGKGSEFIIELPLTSLEENLENQEEKAIKQSYVERINLEFSDIYS